MRHNNENLSPFQCFSSQNDMLGVGLPILYKLLSLFNVSRPLVSLSLLLIPISLAIPIGGEIMIYP
uniref:Uncharacterized protein n=1 Tax=Manihot esculenta TaxID=3983 RepID=A0A2C9UEB2_MANES